MATRLHIDVHVDVICPWCWIGKLHLQAAIATLQARDAGVQVQIVWHPVQLLPDLPPGGVPFRAFYERRLGSAAAVQARQAQVREAAAQAGLHIDFDLIARMPSSTRALALLAYAGAHGSPTQAHAVLDRLFAAHFQQGLDLGDAATVQAIASQCGLNGFAQGGNAASMRPADLSPPISGVPYFVFDQYVALAGAQPPQRLLAAMDACLATKRIPCPQ